MIEVEINRWRKKNSFHSYYKKKKKNERDEWENSKIESRIINVKTPIIK